MSTLMRAPKECGSWHWDLDEAISPGLGSALNLAARMVGVLRELSLLDPVQIEYTWYVRKVGPTGIVTSLSLGVPLGDPKLPDRVLGSKPAAFPAAETGDIAVVGSGIWYDADGKGRKEPRLVDLSVSPSAIGLSARLAVHHDIWSWFDFSGRPHPEVYHRNAPRLADALRALNAELGVPSEPGEPTYFGSALEFGVSTPDADDEGLGPNLADRL